MSQKDWRIAVLLISSICFVLWVLVRRVRGTRVIARLKHAWGVHYEPISLFFGQTEKASSNGFCGPERNRTQITQIGMIYMI